MAVRPKLPSKVVVVAREGWCEGMAILLELHMETRNHYRLVVFLDATGRAEVTEADLLRSAREDAAAFPMDYVDLATGYAGLITAELLSAEGIDRALEAQAVYRKVLTYPPGYREALLRARRLAASKPALRAKSFCSLETVP